MDPPRVPVVKITTVKVKGHRFNGFFYFIIKFCLYDCILFPLLSYRCSYVAEVLSTVSYTHLTLPTICSV